MVQNVDGWVLGAMGGASTGAVAGGTGEVERAGGPAGVVHCLPISIPIRKSRMQSNTTQVAAIATIREVIVKTYWFMVFQGIISVNCPGTRTWITPAHMHMSFELFCRLGILPSNTVGAPGTHGAGVTGMQGIGVNTPSAAAVAAATIGFARLLQTPKGKMFTMGLLSMMFAAGMLLVMTLLAGKTTNVDGAAPKLH